MKKQFLAIKHVFLLFFCPWKTKNYSRKQRLKQTLRLLLCFVLFGFSKTLCPFQIGRDG